MLPTRLLNNTNFMKIFDHERFTFCMENLGIPGRIQMELLSRWKFPATKSNTFRGTTLFPFYFLYYLFG